MGAESGRFKTPRTGLVARPKTLFDFSLESPVFRALSEYDSSMAEDYPFRPCRIQHTLCRIIQEGAGPRQRLTVVPGHPLRRRLLQLLGVAL